MNEPPEAIRCVCCPGCGKVQDVSSLGGANWLLTLEDDDQDPHHWWCLHCGYTAVADIGWTVFAGREKKQASLF